ncbi:ABC transporter permease [Brucella intermedia]|uniref:ABC transporter permease n=1 Tax=Brucella TaxID=234 RepID=UPI00147C6BA7|nr:ABC transporter permease [Brucella intermedia]
MDFRIASTRTMLALAGIAIGTAAVIAMLHIGHNARLAALRSFEGLGSDLISIQPQIARATRRPLSIADVIGISKANVGLISTAAIIQTGGHVRHGRARELAIVLAASDRIYDLSKARLSQGRFTSDLDGHAPFAVVGAEIASKIQAATGLMLSTGDQISFGNQVLTVVGLLCPTRPNYLLNIDLDNSIVLPFMTARRVSQDLNISRIAGRLKPGKDDQEAAVAIGNYFKQHVAGTQVQVTTARQMIASIEEQMHIYTLLIAGIGGVSLVVGGVGIMNVMLMNIMERRQEIGLRLALGARRKDIWMMFLTETLLVSFAGCTAGIATGYVAGRLFASSSDWQFEPAPFALPSGAAMAVIVGFVFGIYPAIKASRLDPVAALRSE